MLQLALFTLIVGAILGFHFRVLVLFPLTVVGGAVIALVAVMWGEPALTVIKNTAIFWTGLQTGYLFGSLARIAVAKARLGRFASTSMSAKIAR